MCQSKERKQLVKSIKQTHAVICAFKYAYFRPPDKSDDELTEAEFKAFDKFRNDTLFKLVDQWKKMEFKLMKMDGLV